MPRLPMPQHTVMLLYATTSKLLLGARQLWSHLSEVAWILSSSAASGYLGLVWALKLRHHIAFSEAVSILDFQSLVGFNYQLSGDTSSAHDRWKNWTCRMLRIFPLKMSATPLRKPKLKPSRRILFPTCMSLVGNR